MNVGVLALIIAADKNLATTGLTAGINTGLVSDRHAIAKHFDRATFSSGGDNAAGTVYEGILTGFEENASAFVDHAGGIEGAGVANDDTGDADATGFGGDGAEVGGVTFTAGDFNFYARCRRIDQMHRGTGGQNGFALRGGDDAVVADVGADEINAATGRRGDGALIDHTAGAGRSREIQATSEEVLIADTQGAGDKTGGIDFPAGANQNTRRIDQPDLSVGRELTVNQARVGAQHPVHDRTGDGRLDKAGGLALGDVEGLPVQDGAVAVGDVEHVANTVDDCGAIDDSSAGWIRHCIVGSKTGRNRRCQDPVFCVEAS